MPRRIVGNVVGLPVSYESIDSLGAQLSDIRSDIESIDPETIMRHDEDEVIAGVKTFSNGIKTYSIKSEGEPIAIKVGDKFYIFYDNGEFCTDSIFTEQIISDETLTLIANEFNMNSGQYNLKMNGNTLEFFDEEENYLGNIVLSANNLHLTLDEGLNVETPMGVGIKINDKAVATETYVDEALKDIDSGVVKKTGEEEISGEKTFLDTTILSKIASYNAKLPIVASEIEIEAYDNMVFKSTNGYPIVFQVGDKTYSLYDNGMFEAEKISIKEITSGDDEVGIKLDGKEIATKEYVDEALNDIGGGNIEIDNVPTDGSTNAVSSGGVFAELFKKADKTYVDSSIQQAILDSWAEVIEP